MAKHRLGIATGGERRLREATEARIRAKYQDALSAAKDRQQRQSVEEQVRRELEQEMKRISSPYSLWNSQ